MGASIVDIRNMGDALRNTGYKNIESAVAEIIDNSVEANAKNIFIVLREGIATSGRKVVTEIGFLDNGEGMPIDVLGSCLGIGASTRQARKGMGRFGVGLPQASLYACPEIEVYSWQDGIENAYKVYLDIKKIKDGIQTEIEDPVRENIPTPYDYFLLGTL
jgi:DNA topoisomerase VI subunit B